MVSVMTHRAHIESLHYENQKKNVTHKQKSAIKLNIPRRHGAKIDMDIFLHQKDAQK
jgi:hypothetical protein